MQSTADLAVAAGSEDLGVASLALIGPSIRLCSADTIEAGKGRDLAEPSSNEDVLKVGFGARGEDLTVSARVELVDHLTVAGDNRVQGISLKLGAVGESLEAQLGAPGVDNTLVTRVGCSRSSGVAGG